MLCRRASEGGVVRGRSPYWTFPTVCCRRLLALDACHSAHHSPRPVRRRANGANFGFEPDAERALLEDVAGAQHDSLLRIT
jgi:hypothetical protein